MLDGGTKGAEGQQSERDDEQGCGEEVRILPDADVDGCKCKKRNDTGGTGTEIVDDVEVFPVGEAGGEGADTRLARGLGPTLGGECRGLLVPRVDDRDVLFLASVVDREEVPARKREEMRDAVRLQTLG